MATLKALVRVLGTRSSASKGLPIELEALLTPLKYTVRLYVLQGASFFPASGSSTSDPYLKVQLGKQKRTPLP